MDISIFLFLVLRTIPYVIIPACICLNILYCLYHSTLQINWAQNYKHWIHDYWVIYTYLIVTVRFLESNAFISGLFPYSFLHNDHYIQRWNSTQHQNNEDTWRILETINLNWFKEKIITSESFLKYKHESIESIISWYPCIFMHNTPSSQKTDMWPDLSL